MNIRPLLLTTFAFSFSPVHAQQSASKIVTDVPFKSIARLHKLEVKGKNLEAKSIYPTFRAKTRLVRLVNAQVGHQQRAVHAAWVKEARKQLSQGFTPPGPLKLQSEPSLTYFSPSRLVSLRFDSYEYMGGIHGLSTMTTRNFAIIMGKPKELALGDLFLPGFNYRRLIETKMFAKLKKNPAATWVQDGSVKTLTNAQFNNFSLTRDGATWLFNPYEMGPFANGPVETSLSINELGPKFKRSLIVAR